MLEPACIFHMNQGSWLLVETSLYPGTWLLMWISSYQFRYDFVHTVDCNKKESLPVSHAVGKISISPTIVIRVRTLHYSNTYCNFIERYHFPLGKVLAQHLPICASWAVQGSLHYQPKQYTSKGKSHKINVDLHCLNLHNMIDLI